MDERSSNLFTGEIVAVLRSRTIGFIRDREQLITVIESLVRTREDGPPVLVYQLRGPGGSTDAVLRTRPAIDIPAPAPYMGE